MPRDATMPLQDLHLLVRAVTGSAMRPQMTVREQDAAQVAAVLRGERSAVDSFVAGHRPWIYNIARRMVLSPDDAEDVTQEVLLKVVSRLSTFDPERAALRTWIYRITFNHILNLKRRPIEHAITGFGAYAKSLDELGNDVSADRETHDPEFKTLVGEAKASCMGGMLLCLSREQRAAFVVGEILGATDREGAEALDIDRATFRKRLSRAREDLYNFMNDKCGLVNEANPCRCQRKTRAFMREGWVDPKSLRFSAPHLQRVQELAPKKSQECDVMFSEKYAELYREQPFYESDRSKGGAFQDLLSSPSVRDLFDLDAEHGHEEA